MFGERRRSEELQANLWGCEQYSGEEATAIANRATEAFYKLVRSQQVLSLPVQDPATLL